MNHYATVLSPSKERNDIVREISVLTEALTEKDIIFVVTYHVEDRDVFLK